MSITSPTELPRRRAATNTQSTYGWVERAFHWAIALLIPTAIALGIAAQRAGFASDAELARKAWLFSAHKTVGIAILVVALARIAWAISQPRPAPLHPDRRVETFVAAWVHWLLYGSIVLVPVLGWAHHATSEGFAPIWWPFGQSLPFLPKDAHLTEVLATLHVVFERVLVVALLLHVAGTIKHVIVDRDATLARMWRGADPGAAPIGPGHRAPLLAALAVWAVALAAGLALAPSQEAAASGVVVADGASNWRVRDGELAISVTQLGTPVRGTFADWDAAIVFQPEPRSDGTHGTVRVVVATGSLTLGTVSDQATSAEFLASEAFPEAVFEAVLRADAVEGAYVADGTFRLRDVAIPLRLPFTLDLADGTAEMVGQAQLDRRDFGMGPSYPDESSVGFGVAIDVALTAERTE